MTIAAVITAAGMGTRLGSDVPKALVRVAGRSLPAHALDRVCPLADVIVVTAVPEHLTRFAAEAGSRATVVLGGDSRQMSVAAGLAALTEMGIDGDDTVLVHDAARAFMPTEAMRRAIDAVTNGADAAVPVIPIVDTLVNAPASDHTYGQPIDRDSVRAVQTPQVFRASVLLRAHSAAALAGVDATDDATLAAGIGCRVVAVEGHAWGFKVTHAGDLALAEYIAAQS